jgi:hypothetical protein
VRRLHRPGSVGSGVSESKAIGQCQAETRGISVVGVINDSTEVEVILPCLNEAEGLVWVLASMPASAQPIVVDNGSTDGSVAIADDQGAKAVHATQRGYDAACHAGLWATTAPVVAVMDADATSDPREGAWRAVRDLSAALRAPTHPLPHPS